MTEQELVSRHNDIMARMRSWKAECESEAERCFGVGETKQTPEVDV